MSTTKLRPQERQLSIFMYASLVSYLSWGLTCMLAPEWAIQIASFTGEFFVAARDAPLQPTFWEPLANGAMAALITCSFLIARDPRGNRQLALPMIASKLIGSLFAVVLMMRGDGGPTVVAMLLTDIPLLVLTYGFWLRARPPSR